MFRLSLVAVMLLIGLLAIPATQAGAQSSCNTFYIVQRGDTLYRISRTFSTTVGNLQSWNNLGTSTRINAGQTLCVGVVTNRTYTVQRGDTMYSIARRFGVDMNTLARVNNITNLSRINVGQILTIPA